MGAEATVFPWRKQHDIYASYQKYQSAKVRVIRDQRRSGFNELVKTGERVVLPRATDVTADTLDLQEQTITEAVESCHGPSRSVQSTSG